ncbi:hypothetical protein SAMN05444678_101350 [Sphingomonas sp. YR710]|jgi:hypothetical protein|uniref:hypothetical protein n=1 Tax=Sphingomonas sp. YR710 TaxID=1882773 RepID=UPI00088FC67B|nr:hypothetical protein [Sphingomonas sp. YR710]SDC09999.1 hypothetical protein SAMN05444678_101350 [Sphingomonas sp. YR710]
MKDRELRVLLVCAAWAVAGMAAPLTAATRAAGIAAADAAMSTPAASDPGGPVCVAPPPTGQQLAGDMKLGKEGHSIEIENAGGGDSLVKIRHADTGKLAASFFIRTHETMLIDGVPDGEYVIQYAFGPALAADCRSFTRIIKANALPGTDKLKTETIDDDEHTEVKRMSVSYQLYVTETGNVKPVPLDPAAFNAD